MVVVVLIVIIVVVEEQGVVVGSSGTYDECFCGDRRGGGGSVGGGRGRGQRWLWWWGVAAAAAAAVAVAVLWGGDGGERSSRHGSLTLATVMRMLSQIAVKDLSTCLSHTSFIPVILCQPPKL